MQKFNKKVIKKADGGGFNPAEEGPALYDFFEDIRSGVASDLNKPLAQRTAELKKYTERTGGPLDELRRSASAGTAGRDAAMEAGLRARLSSATPKVPTFMQMSNRPGATRPTARAGSKRFAEPAMPPVMKAGPERKKYSPMIDMPPALMGDLEAPPELMAASPKGIPAARAPDLSKLAGEIPKTKSGLKKFMQDYGKFIALGAMAGGIGGKGGKIAAPIIAALPGLIEMMKKGKAGSKAAPAASGVQTGMAHGGAMKKSVGGAIRKFKGGSMNMMKDNLTPKYKKGGDMPKGKAAGEMPQHKKMAMGKPTPQSTGQKFAKGGAAKYASGGMCKGYGISKKIRPTGPMN